MRQLGLVGAILLVTLAVRADDIFQMNRKTFNKAADWEYDLSKTFVSSFKKEGLCGGVTLSICFATLKSKSLKDAMTTVNCEAPSGKCPANPIDCTDTADGNVPTQTLSGADAIGAPGPVKKTAPRKSAL
jgi:hypothetical protein